MGRWLYTHIMKKTTLIVTAALFASVLCSAETIKGSDSKVSYIGRTEVSQDGAVSFDWSATTVRVSFKGKSLKIKCSDTGKDYFNVWIDKEQGPRADFVVSVSAPASAPAGTSAAGPTSEGPAPASSGTSAAPASPASAGVPVPADTILTIFTSKKSARHTAILQKRTEAEQGTFTLQELTTDGSFLEAPAPKSRLIEFVGDSYTCGYGVEAHHRGDPFLPAEENPSQTYADVLGRLFGAETVHISHSGRGIIRNYGDFNQHENMVKLYAQTFDQHSTAQWDPTYKPDLVIIYLGTNDFSVGKQPALLAWCNNYRQLLQKIREFHGPDVPILCMASPCDELMDDYVIEAVRRSGVDGVHFAPVLSNCYKLDDTDLGAAWHPNYNGHRKIASAVAPYVATLTGWELPLKFYE